MTAVGGDVHARARAASGPGEPSPAATPCAEAGDRQGASTEVNAAAARRNQRREGPATGFEAVAIDAYNTDMKRASLLLACAFAFMCSLTAYAQWGSGWTIPAGAEKEVSPVKSGAAVLKQGKSIFDARCARCHGREGKGDGLESEPTSPAADLTDSFRADLNPDGVMFHRVASGKPPVMPAFKDQLSSDEIWTVVQYAKSLRKP